MGIESDGAVKGRPSLQTAAYVGGNLRECPLDAIWHRAPELVFAPLAAERLVQISRTPRS